MSEIDDTPPPPKGPGETCLDDLAETLARVERRVLKVELKLPANLPVRLDRLEQDKKRQALWTGAGIVAGLGALVTLLVEKLTKGG